MKIFKYISFLFLTFIFIFFALGLFTPNIKYQNVVTVNGPAEKVFNLFNDTLKMHLWMPGFVSLINDSGSNFNPGSKRKLLLLQEGQIYEMNETITVFKPNEQLSYLLENSVLHNQVNVFFKAEGTKTIITSNNFVSGNSLIWRSIFFFYKKDFNERGQKILTDFKKMAETQ